MKDIRVIILAGGKGTRLRPYTTVFPKPLMPIGEMPILEIVLRQLKFFGFKKITLSVNHLADLIQAFFKDGSKLGLDISYCIEDRPLGTAGSISLVEDITEPFLVMNGDLLTTIDYTALIKSHMKSYATATIAVISRKIEIDYGTLQIGNKSELIAYQEKPTLEYMVSMGLNVLSKECLKFIPKSQYLDIPMLMNKLMNAGKSVMTFKSECEWFDIGRPDDYEKAIAEFEKSKNKYLSDMKS